MYAEFKEYNQHMLDMQKRRWRFLRDFWALWIMNAILLPIGLLVDSTTHGSLMYLASGMFFPCVLLAVIYIFLMVYFIGIRKIYNWKVGLAISCILIPATFSFIALAAANAAVIYLMEKEDSSIRNETGYPHFVQLRGSYKSFVKDGEVLGIEDEGIYATSLKSDNVVPEDPFEKYRIKPEDDMGMLTDNDIYKE
jgi:hypothetical protein